MSAIAFIADDDLRGPVPTGKGWDRRCLIRCSGKRGKCGEISAMVFRLATPTSDGQPRYGILAAERVRDGYRVSGGATGPIQYDFEGEVEVPRCRRHRGNGRGVAVLEWSTIRREIDRGVKGDRLPTITDGG